MSVCLLLHGVGAGISEEARTLYEQKILTTIAELDVCQREHAAAASRADTLHCENVQLRHDSSAARAAAAAVAAAAAAAQYSAEGVRDTLERQLAVASLDASSYRAECERRAGEAAAADAAVLLITTLHHLYSPSTSLTAD
jgi:hypothetical protein